MGVAKETLSVDESAHSHRYVLRLDTFLLPRSSDKQSVTLFTRDHARLYRQPRTPRSAWQKNI